MESIAEMAYKAFRVRAGGVPWADLLEGEKADWEAVAAVLDTKKLPYAWEVCQGGRTFLISDAEFSGNIYDNASYKPLFEK